MFRRWTLILSICGCCVLNQAQAGPREFYVSNFDGERTLFASALDREVVVLNFWATYCRPCEKEIPELTRMHQEFPGVRLLFMNVDARRAHNKARKMATRLNVKDAVLFDRFQRVLRAYVPSRKIPTTVILKNGEVFFRQTGFRAGTIEALRVQLQNATSTNPPASVTSTDRANATVGSRIDP